jgi:carboxyl-terminal processing protease
LTVIPSDAIDPSKTKLVRITRDKVAITANDAKSEIHEIKSPGGQSYVFGVINVPGFYQDTRARYEGMAEYKSTTRDVERLLEEFKAKKVDAVVMDLRTNSGGSLDEAISLTGLFIDEGPVVQVLDRSGRKKEYRDRLPGVAWEGPMLVLTSPLSASASEIFAGAIQDYGRGLIVGSSSTHGKGTVQNLVGLNGILEQLTRNTFEDDVAGALKYTTHQFYRVSGSSTQVKGVESDIVLPSPFDRFGMREGELPKALAWNAIEPSSFEPVADLSEIITPLSERSKARVEANPEFQYLIHDLAYWKTKEDNPLTSLNQSKRKAENDEWEEIEAKRKKERDQRLTHVKKEDVVQKAPEADQSLASTEEVPDYLLEEALQILADYCHATGNKVAASTGGAKAGTFGDSERLHPNPRTP